MKLSKEKIKKVNSVSRMLDADVKGKAAFWDADTYFRYAKDLGISFEDFTDEEINYIIKRLEL